MRLFEPQRVIDHMGSFETPKGVADPNFQQFLSLLGEGNVWVKLTPIRNSTLASNYPDVRPFHDALVGQRSDRLLWGSDWPYIGMATKPRVEELVDLFDEWTDNKALRPQVFVTNPAALFEPT